MSKKLQRNILATKIILFAVTVGIIGYDISILIRRVNNATISFQVATISEKFPLVPFMWGVLSFHFFGSRLGKKIFGNIPRFRYFILFLICIMMLVLCIANLYNPISMIKFLADNMIITLLIGQFTGLLWYQNKKV